MTQIILKTPAGVPQGLQSPIVTTTKVTAPALEEPDLVTLNDYLNLRDEMSYAEVVGVIKVSGSEVSRTTTGGINVVMYTWKNGRGRGSLTAMFQNDRLINKTQFGLK